MGVEVRIVQSDVYRDQRPHSEARKGTGIEEKYKANGEDNQTKSQTSGTKGRENTAYAARISWGSRMMRSLNNRPQAAAFRSTTQTERSVTGRPPQRVGWPAKELKLTQAVPRRESCSAGKPAKAAGTARVTLGNAHFSHPPRQPM